MLPERLGRTHVVFGPRETTTPERLRRLHLLRLHFRCFRRFRRLEPWSRHFDQHLCFLYLNSESNRFSHRLHWNQPRAPAIGRLYGQCSSISCELSSPWILATSSCELLPSSSCELLPSFFDVISIAVYQDRRDDRHGQVQHRPGDQVTHRDIVIGKRPPVDPDLERERPS